MSEDPFDLAPTGFYRRWLMMFSDKAELANVVARLRGTTQDVWIPAWRDVAQVHEAAGDQFEAAGDHDRARSEYLLAKTYFAIARFPGEITPEKAAVSRECARAYRKACAHLEPPVQFVGVQHQNLEIRCHLRVPKAGVPVPGVLVMCGSDVFKEDRGVLQELCIAQGMAALVMDAPGTGENPFPWEPESVSAWEAAIDFLMAHPGVDASRIGAYGVSRGGYSVMQLAGVAPAKVQAVVAIAGHPYGNRLEGEELDAHIAAVNERSTWFFKAPGDGPFLDPITEADVEDERRRWGLSELGLLDRIDQPVLLINGKLDRLSPISNLYHAFEYGPVGGKEARVYATGGHAAAEYAWDWLPASLAWLARKLSAPESRPTHRN